MNPEESKPPSQVDASKLDVFQIVQYANYCLQRGQVEQAARLVNQLKGEPKNVSQFTVVFHNLLYEVVVKTSFEKLFNIPVKL